MAIAHRGAADSSHIRHVLTRARFEVVGSVRDYVNDRQYTSTVASPFLPRTHALSIDCCIIKCCPTLLHVSNRLAFSFNSTQDRPSTRLATCSELLDLLLTVRPLSDSQWTFYFYCVSTEQVGAVFSSTEFGTDVRGGQSQRQGKCSGLVQNKHTLIRAVDGTKHELNQAPCKYGLYSRVCTPSIVVVFMEYGEC